jgi:mRNA interferase RelE/StbE
VSYQLEFHPLAKKELSKLDKQAKVFIVQSLAQFIDSYNDTYNDTYEQDMIRSSKIKKLKGDWKGFYRLRMRSYRVIYEKIDKKLVIYIVRIAHRKEVY